MTCAACTELTGKPARQTDPHKDLELISSESWSKKSGGMAKGAIEKYRCQVCGKEWTRDTDKNDSHAVWV
jgi:transposase-like protein